MKNKKLNHLVRLYAIRGFAFGLVLALLILLLAADSNAYHDSDRTLADFIKIFPGVWVVIIMPFLCALAGFLLAYRMSKIIRQQNKQMKEEEKRSTDILTIVEALGQGKYEDFDSIEKRSENDELILSLDELRKTLSKNKEEEEKRRKEEEQRTWVTNGVAQFGEILRRNQDNMEELSYTVVRYLVDYMKINQAGFFILNKDDDKNKFFELTGHVAFDRKKFTDKKISWGEGLIGRCGLEKETIYMTDIPSNYINVTSGLGEAGPKSLLIVPLKTSDDIYGAIEMASFREFEEYEIGFVEKTAESIALTISNVQNNMRTRKLLSETQEQSEKMRQQEEELRQNMEEMRATQEENQRREVEMKGILEAINHASISAEFETDGTIKNVNDNFLKTFNYKPEEIEDQSMKVFFFKEDINQLDDILATLQRGETFSGRVRRRNKRGEEIWLLSTYSPVVDDDGEVLYIKSLETNIAEQVKLEEEMRKSKDEVDILLRETRNEMKEQFKEIEAVKIRNEKTLEGSLDAIFTTSNEGTLEFFNAAAEQLWGFERAEVLGQNISKLFSAESIQNNEFIKALVTPDLKKIVGERREVPIKNKFGEEEPVLMMLSEAEVGEEHSFTAFIQKVEVELF
ncbi:MAG: PAS domain S-box protein [Bacteroidales bacterium]|nr:PAS domain S-box protein [Bacteroidales bacterium]